MSIANTIITAFRFGWRGRAKEAIAVDQSLKSEIRNRLEAVDILNAGADALDQLSTIASVMARKERALAAAKRSDIENRNKESWWDMEASGWADGGIHQFGRQLASVFDSLNEGSLAKQVRAKLCFQRNLPLPEIVEPVTHEEPVHAAVDSHSLPMRRALGPEWANGQHGFIVSMRNAPVYSDFLREKGIEHVFMGGANGQPRLCFKTEADMNTALTEIRG